MAILDQTEVLQLRFRPIHLLRNLISARVDQLLLSDRRRRHFQRFHPFFVSVRNFSLLSRVQEARRFPPLPRLWYRNKMELVEARLVPEWPTSPVEIEQEMRKLATL